FFFLLPRPPISPLFPYTTLFRSRERRGNRSHTRHARWYGRGGRSIALHDRSCARVGKIDDRSARACVHWRRRAHRGTATCISARSEEHTSELQSRGHLVCRLLLE